jgi:hypothetical protein
MRLPMLIALGTGLAAAPLEGRVGRRAVMAGEFVRTPKQGTTRRRYKRPRRLPLAETGLALLSFASVVAVHQTGHWFATPFAMLFTIGYAYVAVLVATEQKGRKVVAPVSSEPQRRTEPRHHEVEGALRPGAGGLHPSWGAGLAFHI